MTPLRVAMLTYSVKPRGGVVHAIELARALHGRGHRVELAALAREGEGFFRDPGVPVHLVRHAPDPDAAFDDRVAGMIAAYRDGLRPLLGSGRFDIVHAQDCLSANAALELRDEGTVAHVVRTVHHVDEFRSPSLVACQDRSIRDPDRVVCVSEAWVGRLRDEFGVEAGLVTNGVELERFRPPADAAARDRDRAALDLGERLCVLAIGGIEPRKGALTLVEGFAGLRRALPGAPAVARDRRRGDAVRLPRRGRPLLGAGAGARRGRRRARARPARRRRGGAGVSRRRRPGVSRRSRRASASCRSRRSRPACRSWPRTSTCCGRSWTTAETRCSCRPATGPRWPRRSSGSRAIPPSAGRLRAEGLRTAERYSWARAAAAHEPEYARLVRVPAPIAAQA